MSSNQFKQVFTINIKSSLSKQLLIWFPHVVVSFLLIIFFDLEGLNTLYLFISLICIVVSLIYFTRLHLTLNSKKSIYDLHKNSSDNWSLTTKIKEKINVSIINTSFSSNILIIMNFEDGSGKHFTALITTDSVSASEFRRLKVYVKTRKLNI